MTPESKPYPSLPLLTLKLRKRLRLVSIGSVLYLHSSIFPWLCILSISSPLLYKFIRKILDILGTLLSATQQVSSQLELWAISRELANLTWRSCQIWDSGKSLCISIFHWLWPLLSPSYSRLLFCYEILRKAGTPIFALHQTASFCEMWAVRRNFVKIVWLHSGLARPFDRNSFSLPIFAVFFWSNGVYWSPSRPSATPHRLQVASAMGWQPLVAPNERRWPAPLLFS